MINRYNAKIWLEPNVTADTVGIEVVDDFAMVWVVLLLLAKTTGAVAALLSWAFENRFPTIYQKPTSFLSLIINTKTNLFVYACLRKYIRIETKAEFLIEKNLLLNAYFRVYFPTTVWRQKWLPWILDSGIFLTIFLDFNDFWIF